MELTKKEKIKQYWQTQRPLCNPKLINPFHVRFYSKEWMHSSMELSSIEEMVNWLSHNVISSWSDIIIEQWYNNKWNEIHRAEIGKINRIQSKGLIVLEDIIDDEPISILIEASSSERLDLL